MSDNRERDYVGTIISDIHPENDDIILPIIQLYNKVEPTENRLNILILSLKPISKKIQMALAQFLTHEDIELQATVYRLLRSLNVNDSEVLQLMESYRKKHQQ